MPARRLLRFGEVDFDPSRGVVTRCGKTTVLTPQALRLFSYLVDCRDRIVPRSELLDQVWDTATVSDGALATAIYELRAALGDDARGNGLIRTVRGRGFRFVADVVEVAEMPPALPPTGPSQEAPFFGRRSLLEALHRALAAAEGGGGRIVMLEGEAGIGKTTLVQRFAAAATGARVLWGRCWEHAGAPPFWPWLQVLREPLLHTERSELRRLFGGRLEVLGGLVPGLGAAPPGLHGRALIAGEARFQLFDGVAGLLRSLGAHRPVVVVLDDVHFADRPSLLLLEFLATELQRSRVLVVSTYRGEELDEGHPLTAVLAALSRPPSVERRVISGLESDEVRELLHSVQAHEPSASLVESVLRRTGGNPLFIKELARESERLGDLDAPSCTGAALPQAVRETIRRRLARLGPATTEALGVASVLGREFRLDVLARMQGRSTCAQSWLDEAVRAQVVTLVDRAGMRARFAHELYHEVLYGALPVTRRAALHARAGEALEAILVSPGTSDLAVIAHHFSAALPGGGDAAKAFAYCVQAARAASEMLAYEEAVHHYESAVEALECTGEAEPATLAEVLVALAEARDHAGDSKAARETFMRAAAVARAAGAGALLARAALGYAAARDQIMRLPGHVREDATRSRAAALLTEAFDALEPCRNEALRPLVTAALAAEGIDLGEDVRERLSSRALEEAERLGDPLVLAQVVSARRDLLWSPHDVASRLAMADTIVALAQRTGQRDVEALGRSWRLGDLLELGEIARVREEMETCDRLAEEINQPKYRYHVAVLRASFAYLEGRFRDGEHLSTVALRLGERTRNQFAGLVHLLQQIGFRREQGGLETIEGAVHAAAARFPMYGVRCALAYVLGEMERLDEARAEFESLARAEFADVPRDRAYLVALTLLTEVCCRLRDRRRAARLYALLSPFADRNVVAVEGLTSLGAAAAQLGGLASLLERWDEAEQHFEAALRLNRRLGALALLGQIERAYGEMFLARGRPGDRERALEWLGRGVATAERFGSHALRDRILRLTEVGLDPGPPARAARRRQR